ncbi:hypothetical protein [Corallococcus sp. EGB]|uniref:hypothetical protein n=1 Tax=Corallococcus sp. EGB TaxID=1521117 RepID=UPI001CBD07E6|nr:hypothetical protein [Corallococcus sp. EGB]
MTPGFLRRVFESKQGRWQESFETRTFEPASRADWPNFVLEHPTLASGTLEELRARLEQALQRGG